MLSSFTMQAAAFKFTYDRVAESLQQDGLFPSKWSHYVYADGGFCLLGHKVAAELCRGSFVADIV